MGNIAKAIGLLEEAGSRPEGLNETLQAVTHALGFDSYSLAWSRQAKSDDDDAQDTPAELRIWSKTAKGGPPQPGATNYLELDHVSGGEAHTLSNSERADGPQLVHYMGWRVSVGASDLDLAFSRSETLGPVSASEAREFDEFMPLANQALGRVNQATEAYVRGLFHGFRTTQTAAVLIHADGRAGLATPSAERLFGIDFKMQDGYLWSAHPASNAHLEQLVTLAQRGNGAQLARSFLIHRFDDDRALLARAFPIWTPGAQALSTASLILFLSHPGLPSSAREEDLRLLFGLSKAESEIALMLADAFDLAQIATKRNVSVGTIRVQLKHIFQKMRVRRQSELIRLIAELRSPA